MKHSDGEATTKGVKKTKCGAGGLEGSRGLSVRKGGSERFLFQSNQNSHLRGIKKKGGQIAVKGGDKKKEGVLTSHQGVRKRTCTMKKAKTQAKQNNREDMYGKGASWVSGPR